MKFRYSLLSLLFVTAYIALAAAAFASPLSAWLIVNFWVWLLVIAAVACRAFLGDNRTCSIAFIVGTATYVLGTYVELSQIDIVVAAGGYVMPHGIFLDFVYKGIPAQSYGVDIRGEHEPFISYWAISNFALAAGLVSAGATLLCLDLRSRFKRRDS